MADKNYELELYKLIITPNKEDLEIKYVAEFGWEGDSFLLWIDYLWLDDFMKRLNKIFGNGLFEESSCKADMLYDCVCFDLCEMLDIYDINIESVFPKDKYRH